MVVSRYLVDGIVIAGLVLGTFGCLFLAQGIFTRSGNNLIKQCSIAVVLGGIFASFYQVSASFPGWDTSLFGLPMNIPVQFAWLEGLVIGAAYGLVMTSEGAREAIQEMREDVCESRFGVLFLVLVFLALLLAGVAYNSFVRQAGFAHVATLLVIWLVSLSIVVFLGVAKPLPDRRLQLIGLILTLLGIATQFVSPVLDLLNMPIR